MTYADNWTKVSGDHATHAVYHWADWEIAWDFVAERGELWDAEGMFVMADDDFEVLAKEAARWETSR